MFFNDFSKVFYDGFPPEMKRLVKNVVKCFPQDTYRNVSISASENKETYLLHNNIISFPYRVYLLEPENETVEKLNDTEKTILHCLYSRSCNGYVREKHIQALLSVDFPDWSIPYIVKVCDEYVVEILQTVYENLKEKGNEAIKRFCADNWDAFCKSYNRMISYWNEFYINDCYRYGDSPSYLKATILALQMFTLCY